MDNLAALPFEQFWATALRRQQARQEAEKVYRAVLEVSNRVLGADHPDTLQSRNDLALALQEQGKWQEAEEIHGEVLEVRSCVLGANHPYTLRSLSNLVGAFAEQGYWQEAEKMLRKVLEMRGRVLGADHPDTLQSWNNLALALQRQGKWQEAEKMHREVLEVMSRILGADHQDTLSSKTNLAAVQSQQGKWQAAEEMHREVVEATRRVQGDNHPRTLDSMVNLASVVAERDRLDWRFRYSLDQAAHFGRLRDAITNLRASIEQRIRVDDEHPGLLQCRAGLAGLLLQMNQESDLKEAEDLLRQTVPALQKRYGFKHPWTSQATMHLVFLLEEQGKDAEEWRRNLPDIEEEQADMATEPHTHESFFSLRRPRSGKFFTRFSWETTSAQRQPNLQGSLFSCLRFNTSS